LELSKTIAAPGSSGKKLRVIQSFKEKRGISEPDNTELLSQRRANMEEWQKNRSTNSRCLKCGAFGYSFKFHPFVQPFFSDILFQQDYVMRNESWGSEPPIMTHLTSLLKNNKDTNDISDSNPCRLVTKKTTPQIVQNGSTNQ
jgi:hypothetical protein